LNSVWKELNQPFSIDNFGVLYLQPKAISMSELDFENKKVILNLNLTIAPFVSSNPTKLEKTPLPNLSAYQKEKGLDLIMDVRLSYDSLSSYVNQAIKGSEIEIKKKKIIVQHIEIFGTQDAKMLFKLTFDGSKKGVIYLLGIPKLDTTCKKIFLEDVDFDLKTKSILLKSAKWLFSDRIIQEIKKNAVFELDPLILETKGSINKELNQKISPEVQMNGQIEKIVVDQLFLDSRYLIVRTNFQGDLKLKIE
jgi:hypothetical protein